MAMRPPVKPAAPAPKEEVPVAAPPKSKKKLIISIIVLLLAAGGGAGWYFTQGQVPEDGQKVEKKAAPASEPKFVPMGENFTVNLQREEGDQYLQAGITLKILQPELEEKIKKTMPELRSKLLFLLSSKYPSELQTAEGKKKLVTEIIAEVDEVLGVPPPTPAATQNAGHDAASAPAAAPVAIPKTKGVVDVLFTSFIIQ